MTPVIEVRGLHKEYGGTVAVDDVSFTVSEGEIFGILGPNRAGKTTTVECVYGKLGVGDRAAAVAEAFNRGLLTPTLLCDAEQLPFPDNYFDRVSVAFGLRNMTHKDQALAEMRRVLHPGGLRCPGCGAADRLGVHRRHRDPVLDHQCGRCGRVFNAWTATPLAGTHHGPRALVLILRGFVQGTPAARLARELGIDLEHLLGLRHKLQRLAQARQRDDPPLGDGTSEIDETYQNAGEKGIPHDDPGDPQLARRERLPQPVRRPRRQLPPVPPPRLVRHGRSVGRSAPL